MATFITTIRFTREGMAAIQDTVKRAEAFKATAQKLGAKVNSVYWTTGPFDGFMLFEAPDEETASAMTLQLAGKGNVQTQTARAFTAPEMEKILKLAR